MMKKDKDTKPNSFEHFMYKMHIRRLLIILSLSLTSVLLYFFHFRVPMLPRFFSVEFSAFPELLLTYAYGPFYGIIVCLVKNVVHIIFMGNSVIPDAANFVCEGVFLLVAGVLSPRISESVAAKNNGIISNSKRVRIKALSSLIAIVAELILQFALTILFVYPLLIKFYPNAYSSAVLLSGYNGAMSALRYHLPKALGFLVPDIRSLWQGIALVNIPVSFAKLIVISVLTLLIYFLVMPLLFPKIYREK